jgi:hypothetical protein
MRSFSVDLRGHSYRGAWLPLASDIIEVRCDYGRTKVYLEGRQPGEAARTALAGMIPQPERSVRTLRGRD